VEEVVNWLSNFIFVAFLAKMCPLKALFYNVLGVQGFFGRNQAKLASLGNGG